MSIVDQLKSTLNKELGASSDLKKTIDGQLYWHRSLLHKWGENEKYRLIKTKGWTRLLKSLKKYGWKEKAEIDEAGTIYDGNNRYEGTGELLNQGITTADNGKSLEWIPVHINPTPKNEVEALAIAAKGNGDKDFAIWNKDAVANHRDLFEAIPDVDDLVFDDDDAMTFGDTFDYFDEGGEDTEDEEEETTTPKEKKEIECPSCKFRFTP